MQKMKKAVLLIVICLFSCFAKADEPLWVDYISSKDSTVWIVVNIPDIIYKIVFDGSGKICWGKETDSVLCNTIKNEYSCYIKHINSTNDHTKLKTAYDKKSKLSWSVKEGELRVCESKTLMSDVEKKGYDYLCFCESDDWINAYQIPVIDEYNTQGVRAYTRTEEEACPKEKEANPEDYDNEDDYEEAIALAPSPSSICFCDGRKVGYIKDSDGYVNFRNAPSISAPIIGIILDNVQVFYWDDKNNGNWYRVEINDITGYVSKSRVR